MKTKIIILRTSKLVKNAMPSIIVKCKTKKEANKNMLELIKKDGDFFTFELMNNGIKKVWN